MPVTGGHFRVESIDPQWDEILWRATTRSGLRGQAGLVPFRRGGAPAALAESIRNGDTQVAQIHGGAATFAQLSGIPDVRTARIVTPRVMQVTLRAQQPILAETQVRKAILGLLDVDLLASVGAGDDNPFTQAQARSPSDPGYVPTAPPTLSTRTALGLLADAGDEVQTVESPTPPTPGTQTPDNIRGRITAEAQSVVAQYDRARAALASTGKPTDRDNTATPALTAQTAP
jgi:hypothetical protein